MNRLIVHYKNGSSYNYGTVSDYYEDYGIMTIFFTFRENGKLYDKIISMRNIVDLEWY